MEATSTRYIRSGYEYDRFFLPAEGKTFTVKKNANLYDTLALIPQVVEKCVSQTKSISKVLQGNSVYDTCSNIWEFVYTHIQYKKDKNGYEQIRSPARAWHDRRHGVDCDCYSVFISSILSNLNVPHLFRITKYKQDHFQHIYPVVPTASGEIIIDCVTNQFNYEVPYSAKKDFPMDLQFLNGIPDPSPLMGDTDLFSGGVGELGELGKIRLKGLLNKINKFNPATVLLRNGLLASMKLNIGNVAGRLRWSYLTPQQAAQHRIDPAKLSKLIAVRKKLESIFYGAGGKLDNLKKAILKGKGNKDKAVVAGLGDLYLGDIEYMNGDTPLEQLLGPEMYYSENERSFQGLSGFGELGEPLTLTSVAAASGVIAKIAASLKKIGSIFKGGGAGKASAASTEEAPASSAVDPSPASSQAAVSPTNDNAAPESYKPVVKSRSTSSYRSGGGDNTEDTSASSNNTPVASDNEPTTASALSTPVLSPGIAADPVAPKSGFWEKNKSWLKPVAIGAGGLTLLAIGFHLMNAKRRPVPSASSPPLSGLPHKKKKNHKRKQKKHTKKRAIGLM